uniref:Pectinesterase n=1 Tax=Oryza glumipatula TaxID=40148 RepID=A0A0D9ZN44_9ORYZ
MAVAAATRIAVVVVVLALEVLAPAARGLRRDDFPPGFLFGAATSAYQIEGAYLDDNKGLNNWDVFTHLQAGRISDGRNGDVADDHYHRCPRIIAGGRLGGVNSAGIAFYNRLINALLQKGIQPFVTLNHFDIPHELETRYGGWLGAAIRYTYMAKLISSSVVLSPQLQLKLNPVYVHMHVFREEFEYYSDVCFNAFGDRVRFWTTFNEPNLSTRHQYILGEFPPNHCSPPSGDSRREPYAAAHNILLSHAAAVHNYKTNYQAKQGGSIGIVIAVKWYEPLTNSTEDVRAARRFWIQYSLRNERDPLIKLTKVYTRRKEVVAKQGGFHWDKSIHSNLRKGLHLFSTAFSTYFVVPESIESAVMYVNGRYKDTTIYITENGYSQHSDTNMEDLINDVERVNYLQGYLKYLSSAVRKGANVGGYFMWSLIDNFEWVFGYTIKFGLYHVDFDTQERIPKMSAKWYRDFLTGSNVTDDTQVRRMANITMYGDCSKKSIITGSKNIADGVRIWKTATFAVDSDRFTAMRLGIRNTAGEEKQQTLALRVKADKSILFNCRIEGNQDTLFAQAYRHGPRRDTAERCNSAIVVASQGLSISLSRRV